MTELARYSDRLYIKLELNSLGGSHKYRAARHIVERAVERGDIIPGCTTVIEKTGGNFGFGLLAACYQYNVGVDLAVGLSFSPLKRKLLECFGARLIGKDLLEQGLTPREVVELHVSCQGEMGKQYYYSDQFNNRDGIEAHRISTGPELANQLVEQRIGHRILFVGCAGTGASFTGVTQALIDRGFDVDTVLVEPVECDTRNGTFGNHRLEGMAVGVIPPFLDWSLVNEVRAVSLEETLDAQRHFYRHNGVHIGNTSAGCFAVARQLLDRQEHRDKVIITMAYDSGLWYADILDDVRITA